MAFSKLVFPGSIILLIIWLSCLNLIYLVDDVANVIGYFGAAIVLPIILALLIALASLKVSYSEYSTSFKRWYLFICGFSVMLPPVYLLIMVTFTDRF